MALYKNVIRNVQREEKDDEEKLGYEFWNKVENAPVIKQIGNYFQENNERKAAYDAYARSKENTNLLTKGLSWTVYGLEKTVSAPFQLIDMGLEEISDRTNIDKRSLKLGLDLALASRNIKGSKTGAYNKGVYTRQGINKQYNKLANIFKKPGDQLLDIKGTRIFDDVAGLSINDASIAKLLNPIFTAKELGLDPTGTTFFSMDTPEPAWRQTPDAAEKQLWMDRFKNEVFDQVDSKGRPIHISKMTPNAYKELGKFRTEWNTWSKDNQFIRELSDKPSTAYVEHLVRKEKGLDWFWSLPNEVRFRKGSRHSPNNVRILYDNRYKSLKDASEYILYNMQSATDPMNRLVIDLDIPKMKGKSITYKQAPRDIVIKRVDGTIVGRLGDYYDVLYAPYEELKEKLGTNINPQTNKPYININLSEKAIKDQISMWRTNILRGKISFIINQAPTLKGQTKKEKWQYQGSAIQQDMVDFLDEYKFLEPAKGFRKELKSEPFQSSRGGKPIKTEKDELEGRFLTKTQEREIMNRKYRRSWFKRDLDDIFGPDRDDR